jgi:transposase
MKRRKHLEGGNLPMRDVSQIFKLLLEGSSHSAISRKLGIARSTVRDYKVKADGLKLSYLELSKLSSKDLESRFGGKGRGRKRKEASVLDLKYLSKELLKKGVTKLVLYEEYYSKVPEDKSISYSAFCSRIREYQKASKLSMKQAYKAGEKYFIDFSGLTVPIYSSNGSLLYKAQIFVSTLGLSNLSYVEAVVSQRTEDFVGATVRALSYLGGVPECLVPDNLKAAVTKNNGYEADINRTYSELANYYGLAVVPARARKPQDKAKVETSVKLVQQSILAPLRNYKFSSLRELNQKIKPLLEQFNNKLMQSYGYSRKELFDSIEKPVLSVLPSTPYEMCVWKKAKVHPDYHVSVEECYYSVPYRYRGKTVDICIKDKLIEVYDQSDQIAIHKRVKLQGIEDPEQKIKYRFSTNNEHMPASHLFVKDWTRTRALSLASSVGLETKSFTESLFAKYKYEPQAVRAVMALPSLKNKYGKEMLEMAATMANRKQIYSMKYVRETLKELFVQDSKATNRIEPIPEHSNVRGSGYYNKH